MLISCVKLDLAIRTIVYTLLGIHAFYIDAAPSDRGTSAKVLVGAELNRGVFCPFCCIY